MGVNGRSRGVFRGGAPGRLGAPGRTSNTGGKKNIMPPLLKDLNAAGRGMENVMPRSKAKHLFSDPSLTLRMTENGHRRLSRRDSLKTLTTLKHRLICRCATLTDLNHLNRP